MSALPTPTQSRVRAAVPFPVRALIHRGRAHARLVGDQGINAYLRWSALKASLAWKRARRALPYRFLTPAQAWQGLRSDTVFVFGSGASLNDLTPGEWAGLAAHDTLGFSGFVYQRWVRTDFHLVRGWDYGTAASHHRWRGAARAYARQITDGRAFFDGTVFVMQDDYTATFARTLLTERLLPHGSAVLTYRTRRPDMRPSRTFEDGLSHGTGTLCDAVNFAYVAGWRHIVLVGVDLYDSRYFWVPPDRTVAFTESGEMIAAPRNLRGSAPEETHHVVRNGVVDLMGRWASIFAEDGVRLSVYNPQSLLRAVLPLYEPAAAPGATAVVS